MANTIRIKRRTTGNAGAPSSLEVGELAYNEIDDILYLGKYNNNSPVVVGIGGRGEYVREVTGSSPIASSGGKTPQISLSANYGDTQNPYASKTANYVLASPNGSSGTPSFRQLAAADIPSLTASKISDFQTTVLAYRLDQFAAPTSSVAFNNQKITGLGTPTSDADAATKAYVDAMASGVHAHPAARAATTANLAATYNNTSATLTATSNGAITVDGVSLTTNDRVLVKDQTSKVENGIYVVTTVGTGSTPFVLTRATDMNEASEFPSSFVFVSEGTTQADNGYVCTTNAPVVVGTTDIDFTQFSGAGQITAGAGLTQSGNTINVASTGGGSLTISADSINLTSGIATVGTYQSVTVDTYGRVTAGTNPTTLSGFGITDAQPVDATLTALAAVTTAADKLIYATGSDSFATTDFTSTARSLLDDTSTSAMRTTLGLAIGTDVQAYNAALASIAGLTTLADRMIYTTASNTYATTTLTSFARTLLDDADNTAARSTLGLGTIATQAANSVSISGGSITNLTTFDGITIDCGTF
jgi:hypothetical protein